MIIPNINKLKCALLGMSQLKGILWLDKDMSCEELQQSNIAFHQDDPDQDGWSKITRIIAHKMNRRINSGKDLSVHQMYHDQSDLGSLILIRIIPKERTLV